MHSARGCTVNCYAVFIARQYALLHERGYLLSILVCSFVMMPEGEGIWRILLNRAL